MKPAVASDSGTVRCGRTREGSGRTGTVRRAVCHNSGIAVWCGQLASPQGIPSEHKDCETGGTRGFARLRHTDDVAGSGRKPDAFCQSCALHSLVPAPTGELASVTLPVFLQAAWCAQMLPRPPRIPRKQDSAFKVIHCHLSNGSFVFWFCVLRRSPAVQAGFRLTL